MKFLFKILFFTLLMLNFSCKNQNNTEEKQLSEAKPKNINTPAGMVWIPGGKFMQGAEKNDSMAMNHEKPAHPVEVSGFFMDTTEVTNRQFAEFVDATGYVTLAEKPADWEELKKQLPPGTPKPHDSLLAPGSLLFKIPESRPENMHNYTQWWEWKTGANWKHPAGPDSSIEGKENHPVVHVNYDDALAYCHWANRRLPTEAEWEYAAKGGVKNAIFEWGDDYDLLEERANTWTGEFPIENTATDGFTGSAPVGSYPANPFGLHDMAGNVWELTSDWYNTMYYHEQAEKEIQQNPEGAKNPYNPSFPGVQEKVIKGGSFLCNASYCASFRSSARMAQEISSSHGHVGFRTVATPEMLKEQLRD